MEDSSNSTINIILMASILIGMFLVLKRKKK